MPIVLFNGTNYLFFLPLITSQLPNIQRARYHTECYLASHNLIHVWSLYWNRLFPWKWPFTAGYPSASSLTSVNPKNIFSWDSTLCWNRLIRAEYWFVISNNVASFYFEARFLACLLQEADINWYESRYFVSKLSKLLIYQRGC